MRMGTEGEREWERERKRKRGFVKRRVVALTTKTVLSAGLWLRLRRAGSEVLVPCSLIASGRASWFGIIH